MCRRNIDQLPLSCPQPGAWLATHACALTGNQTGWTFGLQDNAQPTEPHQPGLGKNAESPGKFPSPHAAKAGDVLAPPVLSPPILCQSLPMSKLSQNPADKEAGEMQLAGRWDGVERSGSGPHSIRRGAMDLRPNRQMMGPGVANCKFLYKIVLFHRAVVRIKRGKSK